MKKQLLLSLVLLVGLQLSAQENIFLERDFWNSKPTVESIDLKIKEGNDITAKTSNNFDAVVYAILQENDNAVIKYVQSKDGNDVNKLTHDGRTYMFWAAYKGNTEIMEYLIAKGAKTTITDDKGSTILNFAAASGQQNTKVYDICLANGADLKKDLNPHGANALLLSAANDPEFKLMDYFTSKGLALTSVDRDGNDAFNYVAKTGDIAHLKKLHQKGIKGNDIAFIFATQAGRNAKAKPLSFYKFLESLDLNPKVIDSEGKTPLHNLASYEQNKEVLDYFMAKGVAMNLEDADGNTAFLNAAGRNKLEVISYLLPMVDDVNHVNKKGESALAIAVAYNSPEVVSYLLKNKAAISSIDKEGNTLAYYLLKAHKKSDFEEKLKVLKAAGFDLAKTQENGNTLFHIALEYDDIALLKRINEYGIDVNAKNKEGIAPLHLAAMKAKDDAVLKYLLSIGAKKAAVTDFDESVYDLAAENELLQENNISIEFLK
ncbi:ankyrin repeat domain-containing protein [Cellulophaga sp. E16_2]|uniref:ankyrin repeat domain-containing protein n=1 Tax=Cellulophaga sp. E16_2 TaxID=2789297 RepID=UPI001A90DAB2|nr:ankyrin repeat domain-containing protein [Cellulophaga sp. E16_2]MBO0591680.1 ankyrin repeat domain-containing protein [Cellulophaga sp. E16_2]